RWVGSGSTGERFLDPTHPYAADLDLFGPASLFELLSTARTYVGEETLANWLLAPASYEVVQARQGQWRNCVPSSTCGKTWPFLARECRAAKARVDSPPGPVVYHGIFPPGHVQSPWLFHCSQ